MDTLSEVLKSLHLKSAVYFQSDFPSTWGMTVPQGAVSQFHMIVSGKCLLESAEGTVVLQEGDIVVAPFGDPHLLYGRDGNRTLSGMKVVQSIAKGQVPFDGDDFQTRIICGHFEMDISARHPLLKSLPSIIHIKKEMQEPWLISVAEGIISETASKKQGSSLITTSLAEVLFIHVLRAYVSTQAPQSGFLAALFDKRIGESLHLMHSRPEYSWTLEELASRCGMSRTLFANRFRGLVETPPMQYLTDLRMAVAGQLLKGGMLPLIEIAEKVGYGSEAAFIRSFKRKFKLTPAQYRRSA